MIRGAILTVLLVGYFGASARIDDPEEVLDLFEGDIQLSQDDFRSAINDKQKLWPNGRVPYEVDDPKGLITPAQMANLTQAMQNFAENTCVQFHENSDPELKTLLRIQKSKSGCSSNVGMMSSAFASVRGQTVRLSDECFEIGKITHELMHALGFFHEQSRTDRDSFVRIVAQNVEQGKMRQFRAYTKSKEMDLGAPYDYNSLMHYPKWAFSLGYERETIVTTYEAEIGQRTAMSKIDIWKINKLYNCPNPGPVPQADRRVKLDTDAKELFRFERSFNCDFEFFYTCDMHDLMESDFDWQIGNGKASKYMDTGPTAGSDGEKCCYIYMDTLLSKFGDKAALATPAMQPTLDDGSCFTFSYYMYGSTVGTLEVFWREIDSSEEHLLMKESGSQGERWLRKRFVLNIDKNFEIIFRGTVGGNEMLSHEGNIAIDDINILPMIRLRIKGKKCE